MTSMLCRMKMRSEDAVRDGLGMTRKLCGKD
jgi:hypothetical protein